MQRRVRVAIFGLSTSIVLALSTVLTVSAAPVRFGSKLTPVTQPQPAIWCDEPNDTPPHDDCTWIMKDEYSDGPGLAVKAPKAGTIGRVRLQSCSPGSFRIQVAHKVAGTNRYFVRKNGPMITYDGDLDHCDDDTYRIEGFATNFTVRRGDRIAIKAKRTGTVRCGSGGDATLQFHPPLLAGGNSRQPSDGEGCFLLIQWVYR